MPKILRELLGGRDPSNEEMDAFLTYVAPRLLLIADM
jgi:hypothetical protein